MDDLLQKKAVRQEERSDLGTGSNGAVSTTEEGMLLFLFVVTKMSL